MKNKNKNVNPDYLCRIISGDCGNRPVKIVQGALSPRMIGESYHAESRTGIWASMAALRKYWSTYHYVASTMHTEVGDKWLKSPRNIVEYHTQDGVRSIIMTGRASRVGHVRVIPGWIASNRDKIFLVTRGNRSYHVNRSVSIFKITRNDIEGACKEAIQAWKLQDSSSKIQKQIDKNTNKIFVTLEDSRKAGNCIEGTLQFAERKLKIDRKTILDSSYLFMIPAYKLLKVAGADIDRVRNTIRIAWMRETLVSI